MSKDLKLISALLSACTTCRKIVPVLLACCNISRLPQMWFHIHQPWYMRFGVLTSPGSIMHANPFLSISSYLWMPSQPMSPEQADSCLQSCWRCLSATAREQDGVNADDQVPSQRIHTEGHQDLPAINNSYPSLALLISWPLLALENLYFSLYHLS